MSRSRRRITILGATGALLASSLATPSLAGPPIASGGEFGVAQLAETRQDPAARCRFEVDGSQIDFDGVRVRAPRIYAEDRTPGTDEQSVGWRIFIQRKTATGWSTVRRGPVQDVMATDDTPADLDPMVVGFEGRHDVEYRARAKLLWFKPAHPESVRGWVVHSVVWYRDPIVDHTFRSCLGGEF